MTSSNLVGLDNGQVSGLGTLEDAPDVDARLAPYIHNIACVAHQPAYFDKIALRKRCGRRMAYCQIDQLHAPAAEKGIAADHKRVTPLAHKHCESRIDLRFGASVENVDLQPEAAGSRFHVPHGGLGSNSIGGIDEHGNASRSGHQLTEEPQPLCRQFTTEKIDPRHVAAGAGEVGDKTKPDRVLADDEHNGRSSWLPP